MQKNKHWNVEIDEQQIAWVYFDKKNSAANTISRDVILDFQHALQELKAKKPIGVVIASAKPNHYCLGADVKEFSHFNEGEINEFLKHGHEVFHELEVLAIPTVAMINGHCLGGGYELALACKYRVILDDISIKIGLPEIMLGIHPGWGGTIRLPKLIGSLKALPIILQGQTFDPITAGKLGMVDAVVPERMLKLACIWHISQQPQLKKPPTIEAFFQFKPIRSLITDYLAKQVERKAKSTHYPAPNKVLKLWKDHYVSKNAFINEIDSVTNLSQTETARNLVKVFHLRDKLKGKDRTKTSLSHIHIIGAGTMGGDIALACALNGYQVTLQDNYTESISKSLKRGHDYLKKKLRKSYLVNRAYERIMPDEKGIGLPMADLVIEAVIENVDIKRKLFQEIEPQLKKDAILATNTSSIVLSQLKEGLKRPSRLVGIHFFNPVMKMPLVELIVDTHTPQSLLKETHEFVLSLQKLPLKVKSHPGFLVNRILIPYLMEAFEMITEQIPKEAIDLAATQFGMPMGPIELADQIGLDVCHFVGKSIAQALHVPTSDFLLPYLERRDLGKKTGHGFYHYKNQKPIKDTSINSSHFNLQEIIDRLILRMLIEAYRCLQEGIVADADAVDAGMIFGAGFPPFRGGLMTYAQKIGNQQLQLLSEQLTSKFGERFYFQFAQ